MNEGQEREKQGKNNDYLIHKVEGRGAVVPEEMRGKGTH